MKQQSGHELLSQSIKIEVYAPPRIHPYELSLAPGASYVVCIRLLLACSLFNSLTSLEIAKYIQVM